MNIVVSNLPPKADRAFLDVLFDGQVIDSVWAGYGVNRFAIVALRDKVYAQQLLDARAAFQVHCANANMSGAKKPGAKKGRGKKKDAAAVDAQRTDDGMTVEELLNGDVSAGGGTLKTTSAEANATALELSQFFGDIVFGDRVLFIGPSAITVADVLATGCAPGMEGRKKRKEKLPGQGQQEEQNLPAENAQDDVRKVTPHTKRPRETDATQPTADATSTALDATPISAQRPPRAPREKKTKGPQRTALADDSDEDKDAIGAQPLRRDAPSSEATAAVSTSQRHGAVDRISSSSAVQGSKPVTTTPSRGGVAASGGPAAVAQQQPRPVAPAAPSFTRTSKDQCKHCGSEVHLSRHCPNK